MQIKLKLSSGKEIELTWDELKEILGMQAVPMIQIGPQGQWPYSTPWYGGTSSGVMPRGVSWTDGLGETPSGIGDHIGNANKMVGA